MSRASITFGSKSHLSAKVIMLRGRLGDIHRTLCGRSVSWMAIVKDRPTCGVCGFKERRAQPPKSR